MGIEQEYNTTSHDIIGAAFTVRKFSGRGLREKYYEKALAYELLKLGHQVDEQVSLPAFYRGIKIDDSYQMDLVIDNKIIIEVKAKTLMNELECRQLLTYLKLSHLKLGYLINFGAENFKIGNTLEMVPYTYGIYRFINT